jgi:4-hydroxy-2-oxoglutarate aldolase
MTPFFKDGEIDYEGLAFNIEKMNQTDLGGYMPLGSNGEFRSLTDGEALEVIKLIAKNRAPGKTLMAGTGRESAYATIEFTKKAAQAGAEFASVRLLERRGRAIRSKSSDLPMQILRAFRSRAG